MNNPSQPSLSVLTGGIATRIAIFAVLSLPGFSHSGFSADAVFSNGRITGDADSGVSATKTYVAAANVIGGNVSVNSVTFVGSGTDTFGSNWSLGNIPSRFPGGGNHTVNFTTSAIDDLFDAFQYGGNPGQVTFSGLTPGETYVATLYNESWTLPDNRGQNLSSTEGATGIYNPDAVEASVLRYSFVASGNTTTLNFAPLIGSNSFHVYGLSNEQVFTNTFTPATDNSWHTAANWSSGVPNGVGSNANFAAQSSPTTIALNAPASVGHIQFGGTNAFTVSGSSALTLHTDAGGASVLKADAGSSHTVSVPVALNSTVAKLGAGTVTLTGAIAGTSKGLTIGNGSIAIDSPTADLTGIGDIRNDGALLVNSAGNQTYHGVISGTGALTKSGPGTLTLGNASNYTGATSITGGTVTLGTASASLGLTNPGFETPAFGPGDWTYLPAGSGWDYKGSGIANNGAPWVATSPEGSQVGFIQQNGFIAQTLTVGMAGTYNFSFQAANRPGYNPTGIRLLVDGLEVANLPATGFQSSAAFQPFTAAGINLSAGEHTIAFVGNNTLGGDTATAIDAIVASTTTFGKIGTGSLSITNGATFNLGGQSQNVGQVGNAGAGNGVVGNILTGLLNIQTNNMFVQEGTITADITSTAGSNGRMWIGGNPAATVNLGGVNTVRFNDTHSIIIGHGLTGAAGTVKLLTPTAIGPATEETQLFTGTLDLNGQPNVTVGALRMFAGGTLANNNVGNPASTDANLILQFFGVQTGNTQAVGGDGNLTLNGAVTTGIDAAQGGLRKVGSGTLALTSTNSNYPGVTIFEGGVVDVASIADYGVNSSLGNRAADTGGEDMGLLFRGGTLRYTGSTPQSTNRTLRVSTLAGGGTIEASGTNPSATLSFTAASTPNFWENGGIRTLTLSGTNTGDNTFAIGIPDINGVTVSNVAKTGPGKWILSGNSGYYGTTEVQGGTLIVNGSLQNTSGVGVSFGATLGGSGSINPAVSVFLSGTIAPGNSIGTLGTGAVTLDAGSTLAIELDALAGDQLSITGAGTLGGAVNLTLDLLADPVDSTVFTLLNGTLPLNGYSAGGRLVLGGNPLDEGELFLVEDNSFSQFFQISYMADSGNDITLTAVPEPATMLTLLGGIAALACTRRRRQ